LKKCSLSDLKGGTPCENRDIIINILKNKERGAKKDVVILNSAFLLKAAGKVEGIELSRSIIEKGIAYEKFMRLINYLKKL